SSSWTAGNSGRPATRARRRRRGIGRREAMWDSLPRGARGRRASPRGGTRAPEVGKLSTRLRQGFAFFLSLGPAAVLDHEASAGPPVRQHIVRKYHSCSAVWQKGVRVERVAQEHLHANLIRSGSSQ